MPYSFTKERNGVLHTFWGDVSNEALTAAISAEQSREDFDSLHYTIFDFERATLDALTPETIECVGATYIGAAQYNPLLTLALVCPDPTAKALIQRHFYTTCVCQIFDNLPSARAWIHAQTTPEQREVRRNPGARALSAASAQSG